MVKAQTIITMMERLAPKKLAEEWDNVGLQLGSFQNEVNRVVVALDLTDEVIDEAIALGAEMIVTHHPFFFRAIKKIDYDTPEGRRIKKMIANDLTLYSAHTNLDIAEGGVNDVLAVKVGLEEISVLQETGIDKDGNEYGLGRIGYLPEPLPCAAFAEQVKDSLGLSSVRLVGRRDKTIEKVALCGGCGTSLISRAAFLGADLLLTGDVKYHEALGALDLGLNIIDAGHDMTEQLIVPVLVDYLQGELKQKAEVIGLVKQNGSVFQNI